MGRQDSKIIKEYCLANIGGVFDVGYLATTVFKDIANDNVRQIVRRLTKTGLLKPFFKGMYLIGEADKTDEERIIDHYLFEGEVRVGMLTGEVLFYHLGLLNKKPEKISLRTNKATRLEEWVGNIHVEKTRTVFGSGVLGSYEICVALDLIKNKHLVDVDNIGKYVELLKKCASSYNDLGMKCIRHDYPGEYVVKLADLLDSMEISNQAVQIDVETRWGEHS